MLAFSSFKKNSFDNLTNLFSRFLFDETEDNKLPNTKNIKKKNPQNAAGTQPNPATGSSSSSNSKPNLNQLQQQNGQHHLHNGSLNGNAGGHDPSGQQPSSYELSMSAMYGQAGLQAGNGQMPAHLLGNASGSLSNNNSSSSSATNGPVSNDLNNGLMDSHLLVEPKQEPEINSQFMQL